MGSAKRVVRAQRAYPKEVKRRDEIRGKIQTNVKSENIYNIRDIKKQREQRKST